MTDRAQTPAPSLATAPGLGSSLEHPTGAGRLIVLATSEQTGGRLTEVEAVCEPGPPGVEERSFAVHEVRFEVLEGRLEIGVGGVPRRLRAGEALTLPPGTSHRIWVEPGRPAARFIWRMRPAHPGSDFLDLVFGGSRPEPTS